MRLSIKRGVNLHLGHNIGIKMAEYQEYDSDTSDEYDSLSETESETMAILRPDGPQTYNHPGAPHPSQIRWVTDWNIAPMMDDFAREIGKGGVVVIRWNHPCEILAHQVRILYIIKYSVIDIFNDMCMKWQEIPPAERPLARVSLDLIDMVSGYNGYRYALTVIDHFSRFVRVYPLKTKASEEVITAFKRFTRAYGIPETILTDNGTEFTSNAFRELDEMMSMIHLYATPYHPQGNAVIERMHGTLKSILAALCGEHPNKWPLLLDSCERALSGAVHGTTGAQPHFAFHGRHPTRSVGARLPEVHSSREETETARQIILKTQTMKSRNYLEDKNKTRTKTKQEQTK